MPPLHNSHWPVESRTVPLALTPARPATFTGPNMTRTFKNPVRCAALVVVFLLAAARGELTLAQDLAPDPNFSPIADKSTPLMPQVILRNIREDRDGNIWFASFAGPIRYDGKTFTDFGEEAGIAGRRIFSLTRRQVCALVVRLDHRRRFQV